MTDGRRRLYRVSKEITECDAGTPGGEYGEESLQTAETDLIEIER